jgi:hypothetical protein
MSRLLPWLTVALLSAVFTGVGAAAPDARPPAKPADNPFGSQPAAQKPKPSRDAAAAKPAAQGPKQPKGGCQNVVRQGPCKAPPCKDLRTGKAAIRRALAEKTQLEFTETPLCDMIEFLRDHHKIEIQLDKKALDDVGVAPDVPITFSLHNISLGAALKFVLRGLGLTYEIRDEMLVITTPEQAESHLEAVVYDVADLVTCRDEKGDLWADYDELIEIITSTIKPTTWDSVGGPGSIGPGTYNVAKVLVVAQTAEVHNQIAVLLKKIRAVIKRNGGMSEPPRRVRPEGPSGMPSMAMGGTAKPAQAGPAPCPGPGAATGPGAGAGPPARGSRSGGGQF